MIEWQAVQGSSRIVAEAYDSEREAILVRFHDGVEWEYLACPQSTWVEFSADHQSRGQYIAAILDAKPNGRWGG